MSVVWCDGRIHDGDAHVVSLRNRGLTLGDGLFETILVCGGVALWLDHHINRLLHSADVLGIELDADDISKGVVEVLQRGGSGLQVLRITVTRGDTMRGLAGEAGASSVFMTLDHFSKDLIGQPVTLVTSAIQRSISAISATHKTLSYVDAVVAARQAQALGCGDALMLNTDGKVACSTIGNIFLLRGNTLVTPAVNQAILPGVMRRHIVEHGRSLGFDVEERAVEPAELKQADGAFLTNSLRLVRPVVALDGSAFAVGKSAAIFEHLCQTIEKQCGIDPRQS